MDAAGSEYRQEAMNIEVSKMIGNLLTSRACN